MVLTADSLASTPRIITSQPEDVSTLAPTPVSGALTPVEKTTLTNSSPPSPSQLTTEKGRDARGRSGIVKTLVEEVDLTYAWIPLIVCCWISGLTDSTLFNAYGTFVSMQTGNTIFIALGTAAQDSPKNSYLLPLVSLLAFVLGAFLFSRIHALLSARRRATLFLSFFLQSVFVIVAAAVIQGGVLDGTLRSSSSSSSSSQQQRRSQQQQQQQQADGTESIVYIQLLPIALLSLQAAGQIVASRALLVSEVPTVVITSLLCDLVSDPALFSLPIAGNVKRNRRVMGFLATLVGGVCGAWISRATGTLEVSLWVVGGVKMAIAGSWLAWETSRA